MSDSKKGKCPSCGRCQECGHVPQPPYQPYRPWVNPQPWVNPWPVTYPPYPYRWTVSGNTQVSGASGITPQWANNASGGDTLSVDIAHGRQPGPGETWQA